MTEALKKASARWGRAGVVERAPPGEGDHRRGWRKLNLVEKPAGAACLNCPLLRRPCVPTEHAAPGRRLLTIVGEAPGYNEVREGRPFIGPSGRFLERQLNAIGIRRDEVTWTNAALCEAKSETETREASRHCAARLQSELADCAIIVPVGAYALSSTMRSKKRLKITKWRGFVIRDGGDLTQPTARLVLPTVHPAFVLRSDIWGPVITTDFERLKRVLEGGWSSPFADPKHRVLVPATLGQLRSALSALALSADQRGGAVSIDVETPMDTNATSARLVCFAMSDGRVTVAVPWFVGTEEHWKPAFGADQAQAAAVMTRWLRHRVAVTHNGASFDHIVLARHGIHVKDWDDTLYAHHAFAGHMPQSLAHVVSMYLDAPPWKEKKHKTYKGLLRYNAHDAQFTALAWQAMQPELASERVPYERTRKAALLCQKMQLNGMRFDKKRAKKLAKYLKKRAWQLRFQATKLLGREINLDSVVQLRKVYFEELEAPVFFHSKKTNAPSLGIDAIRAYMTYQDPKLRELSKILVEYRAATKTFSNFIKKIKTDARSRVHPSWRPSGTVSSRWSCSKPNLLNLTAAHRDPTRELGGVRSLYCAPPRRVLVSFDAKQIEMRVAAYLSGDETMIRACESSDLHATNAALVFKDAFNVTEYVELKRKSNRTPLEEKRFTVLDKLRDLAKRSGFAIAYGAEAPTVHAKIVADGIDVSEPQVDKMLFELKNAFKIYYRFQDELLHRTIRLGYVESPFLKRKRWVGHAPKPNEVMNFPIQAGAAEHVIGVLLQLDATLPSDALLVNYGYDSATWEVRKELAATVGEQVFHTAETPVELNGRKVVFPIDLKIGERWSELK